MINKVLNKDEAATKGYFFSETKIQFSIDIFCVSDRSGILFLLSQMAKKRYSEKPDPLGLRPKPTKTNL